ncbi:hypothetical protein D3C80_918140 [compost metagenome]
MHAGQLHLFVNGGRPHVQRTAEDEREAQHVVYLVRVIGAAGTDNGVRAHSFRQRRQDFRFRVGQRHDQWIPGHGFHHILSQDTRAGTTEEDVGVRDSVTQRTLAVIFNRISRLGLLHIGVTTFVDNPFGVADGNVLLAQPQGHQQVQTGDRRGTGSGNHQPHVGNIFFHYPQAVQHCGGRDDRSTVLIVVEHRDLHALAQFLLDVETLRRFDVFQVNAAEGRLQRGDDVDQLVRV